MDSGTEKSSVLSVADSYAVSSSADQIVFINGGLNALRYQTLGRAIHYSSAISEIVKRCWSRVVALVWTAL